MDLTPIYTAIDRVNRDDPRKRIVEGEEWTFETVYSKQMLECLLKFKPDASDELKIACFAQHIGRWKLPRESFPLGRTGYNMWRQAQYQSQSELAYEVSLQSGANADFATAVKELVSKKNRSQDADAQTLEDVACLVFIEHYAEEFFDKHILEKSQRIARKTWKKMSKEAREYALENTPPGGVRSVLDGALAPLS